MDGSAEGRLSLRAICKEGSIFLQALSAFALVLRVSLVDANSPLRLPEGTQLHVPPDGRSRRYEGVVFRSSRHGVLG
jgi:hypothetical protein